MMAASPLDIRIAARDELDLILDWAAAEGWNPGLADAVPFHAADPEGFLVARLHGQPVAVISATRYADSFGFIGFYIVRPEARGQGHGWTLWQAAMARLAGRNIGLDGVPAQQENYRKSGFTLTHRNVRYEGRSRGAASDERLPQAFGLTELSAVAPQVLSAYDRAFFPVERSAFLQQWIAQPGTKALCMVQGHALRGYGVLRACRAGYKLGPLFADTPRIATLLFDGLCASIQEGAPVFLDVPECNAAAVELAQQRGMHAMFETARMYTGAAPDLALDRTYGVTSFELG